MNLNYEENGTKYSKNVVLIHGLSDDLNFWNPLLKLFSDYHILRMDLPGHGKSENITKNINIDEITNEVYSLIKSKNIEKTLLIGFSLGGAIAQNITIKHPELVESLILMSSFSYSDDNIKYQSTRLMNALKNEGFEGFVKKILPLVVIEDLLKDETLFENIIAEKFEQQDLDSLKYSIYACEDFDIQNKLSEINCPTLIFSGCDDPFTTLNMSKEINNKIHDSKLIVFNNTKHNILMPYNFEELSEEILEFLQKK